MRKIRFRAWDLITARMVHVSVVEFDGGGDICNVDFYNATVNTKKGAHARFHHRENGEDLVLMQFTGLLDKNGKEIYEGDIVRADTHVGQVVYGNYAFFVKDFWDSSFDDPADAFSEATFEVIGNIYETPELLTNK